MKDLLFVILIANFERRLKRMKKVTALLSLMLVAFSTSLAAADNTFIDYQNYNHGYCSSCNCAPCVCDPSPPPCSVPCAPCDPCAPVCGTECGVSICAIGVGVAAVAAAAAIIIASGSGSSTAHQAN